ncbi:hypothetical protein FHR51_000953 [Xanthomonas arboricola]|nr:hypothetical protein [Xanthomonas cannabis]
MQLHVQATRMRPARLETSPARAMQKHQARPARRSYQVLPVQSLRCPQAKHARWRQPASSTHWREPPATAQRGRCAPGQPQAPQRRLRSRRGRQLQQAPATTPNAGTALEQWSGSYEISTKGTGRLVPPAQDAPTGGSSDHAATALPTLQASLRGSAGCGGPMVVRLLPCPTRCRRIAPAGAGVNVLTAAACLPAVQGRNWSVAARHALPLCSYQ